MEHIDPLKKETATKVEVVNELDVNSTEIGQGVFDALVTNKMISPFSGNSALRTIIMNTESFKNVRPVSGSYNVCFGSCVATNSGNTIVVPLNITFYNVATAKLTDLKTALITDLPDLFPAGTIIKYTYSTIDYQGSLAFHVVSV